MSMLSDYQRMVEKPMVEGYERRLAAMQSTLEAQQAEIAALREALSDLLGMNRLMAHEGVSPEQCDRIEAKADAALNHIQGDGE